MIIRHPEIGICGLSCRLCPRYHTDAQSRCGGCKSSVRMAFGCPFITCAVKRKGIEFCWECGESRACDRWAGHREYGRTRDTFTCYGAIEANIAAIERGGLKSFVADQRRRERLLRAMLADFNEGRSKTCYCIAAALLALAELQAALAAARKAAGGGKDLREKSKMLRALLDQAAGARSIKLALRK